MRSFAVLAFAIASFVVTDAKSSFCKIYECPDYTVLQTFDGFELREYSPITWVTTKFNKLESKFWEDRQASSQAFGKLFRYISGANDQKKKMAMTVPVATTHSENEVSMAFMVPKDLADNPPKPTDSDVTIYQAKKFQAYVRSFGGFPYGIFNTRNYFKTNFETLKQKLTTQTLAYDTDMFLTASYNAPFDIFNRHNEVWMVKK